MMDTRHGEVIMPSVHTVPYVETAKNMQGESIGRVMLRAGLSYCIPSSRIREWLDANHLSWESSGEPSRHTLRTTPKPTAAVGFVAHLYG